MLQRFRSPRPPRGPASSSLTLPPAEPPCRSGDGFGRCAVATSRPCDEPPAAPHGDLLSGHHVHSGAVKDAAIRAFTETFAAAVWRGRGADGVEADAAWRAVEQAALAFAALYEADLPLAVAPSMPPGERPRSRRRTCPVASRRGGEPRRRVFGRIKPTTETAALRPARPAGISSLPPSKAQPTPTIPARRWPPAPSARSTPAAKDLAPGSGVPHP